MDPCNDGQSRVDAILLEDSISQLRATLASGISGALVVGSDALARRAVALAVAPDAPVLSCAASSTSSKIASIRNSNDHSRKHAKSDNVIILFAVDSPSAEATARLALDTFAAVVALAANEHSVALPLRRAGRLETVVRIRPSTLERRVSAWKSVLTKLPVKIRTDVTSVARDIALVSPGFSLVDFRNAAYSALKICMSDIEVYAEELIQIVREMKPHLAVGLDFVDYGSNESGASRLSSVDNVSVKTTHSENCLNCKNPWSRIGGYGDLIISMKRLIHWPVVHADTFARLGIEPLRGLLLQGPSGCGKTLISNALLESLDNANWLKVDATAVFSKYLGDSESRVRAVFAQARALEPCVVFIDDIDILCGNRSETDGGVERRVLGALLAELDGVGTERVFVLACTNQIGAIDSAVTRNGRIDSIVHVELPSLQDRIAILKILMSPLPIEGTNMNCSEITESEKSSLITLLAEMTAGFTGADLGRICREAGLIAMREAERPHFIKGRHFVDALSIVKKG